MKDVTLHLYRIAKTPEGVFGTLVGPNSIPFAITGERPDLNNQPNISCIPAGTYNAILVDSPRFNCKLWRLTDVPYRSNIELHPGNRPLHDSEGCILVAEQFGNLNGTAAVLDSRKGFNELMQMTAGFNHLHLTISEMA